MDNLLIIGASGLTGFKLASLAKTDFKVSGTYNDRTIKNNDCEIYKLNKTNKEETYSLIKDISPKIVIDCSALHNVDYCEKNEEESRKVNVEATKYVADACKEIQARMIFISTDYVYDGVAQSYTEESQTNPLNIYGKHKLEAENEIKKANINFAIARTSLVFGWNPNELKGLKSSSGKTMNFVIWALGKLRDEDRIKIVTDQYSTPTLADNLAEILIALAKSDKQGIFHITGKNCLNRYDFTLKICEIFGINKELVSPVTSDMFQQVAERPMRCFLDVSKAERLLNAKLLTIDEALSIMKEQELNF